ncbi:MAG: septum formation initiator family protein [Prevotellaceae bacterium]|jgi:cell division protein FtsB|nr:septum formation initiator family protein [Prevotellaceae bacterium]
MNNKLRATPLSGLSLRRLLRVVPPQYLVATLFFALWVGLFDRNSLMERITIARQIGKMEREAVYYHRQVDENQQRLNELKTDNENLEKFAREQYLMKRQDEDIFIIVE